ncbi:hypothetical protein BRE01_21960 [Brevibacillus reuszeri]|uniref:Barstar (barnase inhibitor) domain-containing protein n=1 Tax=Brevibacillus reuszeri TaxID=54915 RepID=A0ABQ0TKT2_9BACL|nr:barstar family protein [Brevibacillus reuszeri]MED1856758.1 barstar family protein [Brevibacillus reuszeri]GED68494.1 hypothetical protein BRE01_21960 [Brevibacillus reuszeri]
MIQKYSLIDAESDMVIGIGSDLTGLMGNSTVEIAEETFHKITLLDFQFRDDFKQYCQTTKAYINNIYVTILNYEGCSIGSYYFYLREPIFFHKTGFGKGLIELELIGTLLQVASKESLEIWEMRRSPLIERNLWTQLSTVQRSGWLEVARLYNNKNTSSSTQDQQNGEYDIDAGSITDSSSFFCALGEATNGPGGYYGFDLKSLEDCLCGGFGATPPYVLHLHNANSMLNERNAFFQQLMEVFLSRNVKLVYH